MPLKRDLELSASVVHPDGPRTKRRREATASSPAPANNDDTAMADGTLAAGETGKRAEVLSPEEVKEKGLEMWQTIKDAVDKEGRKLSTDFLRQPSKRQYPDYYELIQKPIALEDIKNALDTHHYTTLEAVKKDFDQCFKNAKKYNQKESPIWKDAKTLQKLAGTEYARLTGTGENGKANAVGDEYGEHGNEEGGDKKKAKAPNLTRMLKSRLQKVVEKADDTGRVLSAEFMDLPNKKLWPQYYVEIKRPQCLENIFRKLKRKEYYKAEDFANDVELVFSNAIAFNQDHSELWEDAVTLRDHFRNLMGDLPQPFSLPQYAKPTPPAKLKLKMPSAKKASNIGSSPLPPAAPLPSTSSGSYIAPAQGANGMAPTPAPPMASQMKVMSPVAAHPALPHQPAPAAPSPAARHTPLPPNTLPVAPHTSSAPLNYNNNNTYPHHYSNASFRPPGPIPTGQDFHAPSPAPPANTHIAPAAIPQTLPRSPAPVIDPRRLLRCVTVTTMPRGRPIRLDYRDGVKSWAMRLVQGEKSIHISDVAFMGDEDEEGSQDSAQEEEEPLEVAAPVQSARGRGRGRGRGRPRGRGRGRGGRPPATESDRPVEADTPPVEVEKTPRTLKSRPKQAHPRDNLQVLLNGVLWKESADRSGEWDLELNVGSNVLEVGEKGGVTWKMYLERTAFQ
ncbi:hypothetical protein PLICRDRAFT_152493 [Plicaturopsis crispa FD-325 SS-3]|nr:hypothetical protein PLICRDRAFT_152493 [Plicaturopsis crispa FD-325 SS-3]